MCTSSYSRFDGGRIGVLCLRQGTPGQPQLLCFPHAGGGPTAFSTLAAQLPRGWAIHAVDAPGHGRTTGEPLTSVEELASAYLRALPPALLESVFVGHSLGGYVALALCQAVPERARALVLTASAPPHRRVPGLRPSTWADEPLLGWLQQIGGGWPSIEDPRLFQTFSAALRADLRAYETFEAPRYAPEHLPILLGGGEFDPMCTPERFERWRDLLPHGALRFFPGGHFFLQTHAALVASELQQLVERLPARPRNLAAPGDRG